MGFVEAVKSGYSNYLNYKGRASRSEYWWFSLFFMGVYIILVSLTAAVPALAFLAGAFYLGSLIPFIMLAIRRMHDSDHAGWFCLIPLYSLYLAIIKGTDGPNRFGDDSVGAVFD
ncbi:MAG: DUF805 domain-containing protein [Robiginitomaculum sp.]|nr:MAG: DUF805 domain-containing protein [Robiginitomaculum sp.]